MMPRVTLWTGDDKCDNKVNVWRMAKWTLGKHLVLHQFWAAWLDTSGYVTDRPVFVELTVGQVLCCLHQKKSWDKQNPASAFSCTDVVCGFGNLEIIFLIEPLLFFSAYSVSLKGLKTIWLFSFRNNLVFKNDIWPLCSLFQLAMHFWFFPQLLE